MTMMPLRWQYLRMGAGLAAGLAVVLPLLHWFHLNFVLLLFLQLIACSLAMFGVDRLYRRRIRKL